MRKKKLHKKCKVCNQEFDTYSYNKIFCSDKCKRDYNIRIKILEKNCIICNKKFSTNYKFQKMCSEDCRKKHYTKYQHTYKNNKYDKEITIKECRYCNKEFIVKKGMKYCSKECRNKMYKKYGTFLNFNAGIRRRIRDTLIIIKDLEDDINSTSSNKFKKEINRKISSYKDMIKDLRKMERPL